mmetsp:Transcript_49988/g.93095  ORF Transcript_49988/g.93095 Transcript_49988/m.93095 type:complete len:239 (-) Transcript_49988:634-1350(-)
MFTKSQSITTKKPEKEASTYSGWARRMPTSTLGVWIQSMAMLPTHTDPKDVVVARIHALPVGLEEVTPKYHMAVAPPMAVKTVYRITCAIHTSARNKRTSTATPRRPLIVMYTQTQAMKKLSFATTSLSANSPISGCFSMTVVAVKSINSASCRARWTEGKYRAWPANSSTQRKHHAQDATALATTAQNMAKEQAMCTMRMASPGVYRWIMMKTMVRTSTAPHTSAYIKKIFPLISWW